VARSFCTARRLLRSGGQVADTGAFYDHSESATARRGDGRVLSGRGLVAAQVVAKKFRIGDRVAVCCGCGAAGADYSQSHRDASGNVWRCGIFWGRNVSNPVR